MPFFFLPSNRGPLPDFVQVRHKLKEMSDRIRQLEDALEILQKTNSEAPHPLLQNMLLKIKEMDDKTELPDVKRETLNQDNDLDDIGLTLGTLTISESGISSFLGRGGGAEVWCIYILMISLNNLRVIESDYGG